MFYPTKRKVIVNTKTGKAFRGILWKLSFRLVILRNSELLKPKGETIPIDGELVVLRDEVEFIQVLP